MPLYRVVAQRLFEQAEGLQALGGASGDEPCAPAAQAEVERQQPGRARRCPMMARRGAERSAQLCPGSSPGHGSDCRLVRTLSDAPSAASHRVCRSARTAPVPSAALGRNRLLPQLWYLEWMEKRALSTAPLSLPAHD